MGTTPAHEGTCTSPCTIALQSEGNYALSVLADGYHPAKLCFTPQMVVKTGSNQSTWDSARRTRLVVPLVPVGETKSGVNAEN